MRPRPGTRSRPRCSISTRRSLKADMNPLDHFLATLSRRQFFRRSGLTLGTAALASLFRENLHAAPANPLTPHAPHFAPKAKRVIYLHMIGAPSQLDLFDEKP